MHDKQLRTRSRWVTDSRRKGRSAEQEIARILRDWLGMEIHRNWQQQAAEGGSDIAGVDGWAIEVKRHKDAPPAMLSRWWHQTREQAEQVNAKPVLMFRTDGYGRGMEEVDKWRCVLRTSDVFNAELPDDHACLVNLRCWIEYVRETIA